MKRYFKALGLLAACAGIFSCQQEAAPEGESVAIGFTATLADEDATKTGMTISGNTATFHWEASDQLKVRQIYYRGSTVYPEVATSGKPVWNESGSYYYLSANFTTVNPAPDEHFTGGNKYMYQGFYPASKTTQGSNGKITVTLPAQQTPRSEQQFDANADILYSDAVYSKSQRSSGISGRTINGLTFHRKNAVGVMHITGSPSILSGTGAAVQSVEFISTQGKSLAGKLTFSVDSPNSPSTSSTSSSIKLDFSGITVNRNNFTVCFTCLPASCSGFKVRIVTTKGSYEKTFTNTQTFTAGAASFFDVSMSNATFTPKSLKLMTYNVAAFKIYEIFNLKHQVYLDNHHYWKRPGQSNYVLYDQNDYNSNKRDTANLAIFTAVAKIINTQYEENVPMLVGFNELDSHLKRNNKATANVRDVNGIITSKSKSRQDLHRFQLKQLKTKMENLTSHSWWYYFAKAQSYGGAPGYTVSGGEKSQAYGNGIISSKQKISNTSYSLGNGGVSTEENRCVAVMETEDCVFASVHMGGVASDNPTQAGNVITNQINKMNAWFHSHYNGYSKPVFVCGDFNSIPADLMPKMNAYWTLLTPTDQYTHPSNSTCLDYIFCFKEAAQVEVVNAGVISSVDSSIAPYGMLGTSDHLPIYVKVNIVP